MEDVGPHKVLHAGVLDGKAQLGIETIELQAAAGLGVDQKRRSYFDERPAKDALQRRSSLALAMRLLS